jgi:hypothetical protein
MLTIEQLQGLTALPKMSDISLKLLLEFYEANLCGREFKYDLADDTGTNHSVSLVFRNENFCHLLGLQHIKSSGSKIIQGVRGAQDIKDGRVTFDTLKTVNAGRFKSVKYRIQYFPFLLQLLQNPSVIQFDPALVNDCVITCDLMLHEDYESRKVHLGIEKNTDGEYFAKTYMIENKCGTRYIENQKPLTIQSSQIIIK